MKRNLVAAITLTLITYSLPAQTITLRHAIEQVISNKNATVGISISGIEDTDTVNINAKGHYPMQSVFKLHIALAVLHQVDRRKLFLQQKIFIKKSDLLPGMYSPIRDKYPAGNVSIPLSEIIAYTVSESDNVGCEILLKLLGGPLVVESFIHRAGIKDVAIKASEEDMHKDWDTQFRNWTTPVAASALLKLFYNGKMLSRQSQQFLWKVLSATSTGSARLKAGLPPGTLIAHKTGTSDTNKEGITAAINDMGIVTLSGGHHYTISVFVTNSKESNEVNEQMIADISKAAWSYFMGKVK